MSIKITLAYNPCASDSVAELSKDSAFLHLFQLNSNVSSTTDRDLSTKV